MIKLKIQLKHFILPLLSSKQIVGHDYDGCRRQCDLLAHLTVLWGYGEKQQQQQRLKSIRLFNSDSYQCYLKISFDSSKRSKIQAFDQR